MESKGLLLKFLLRFFWDSFHSDVVLGGFLGLRSSSWLKKKLQTQSWQWSRSKHGRIKMRWVIMGTQSAQKETLIFYQSCSSNCSSNHPERQIWHQQISSQAANQRAAVIQRFAPFSSAQVNTLLNPSPAACLTLVPYILIPTETPSCNARNSSLEGQVIYLDMVLHVAEPCGPSLWAMCCISAWSHTALL